MSGEKITELPTILIGQFAKNELYIASGFSGNTLMQYCLNTLLDGQMRLGGRIVMLECKDIPYLIDFYEDFGFIRLDRDYEKDELIQLIRILKEDDLIEPQPGN
jgi:predicted GNAT family N-acyltransferase